MIKLFLLYLVLAATLSAKHLHKEKYYQDIFCKKIGGITEYVLDDKTRVDCLTDEYAIEVDFASKWSEGAGQGLFYALKTGKKPAVYLIIENDKEYKYLNRLQLLASKYEILIFIRIGDGEYISLDTKRV